MKYIYILIIIISVLFLENCSIANRRSDKHVFVIDGYLIWTKFQFESINNENLFDSTSNFFLVDKKYIEFKWDGSKHITKLKKEIIPIMVLQKKYLPSHPNFYFINMLERTSPREDFLDFYYKGLPDETKIKEAQFFIKKGISWQKPKNVSRFRHFLFYKKYHKSLNKGDVYKVTLNGKDTIKVRPLWDFDYIEYVPKDEKY